jgi:uncharacterized protein YlxP (DUF503 family)
MAIGILTLHIHLPGCSSLKEKRGRLKPLLHRLRKEFNVSVAEIGEQDTWQNAVIGCAVLSTDAGHAHRTLQKLATWVETKFHDIEVTDDYIEVIS